MHSARRLLLVWPAGALAAALLAAAAAPAAARLVWQRQHLELQAGLADTGAILRFPFRNTGPGRVTILEVAPSCGCTTVDLVKRIYARGERGEIVSRFEFGTRTGRQDKTIVVRTDERRDSVHSLTFMVRIPTLLEMHPMFLYWARDQETETRVVKIVVDNPEPVAIVRVTDRENAFRLELRTMRPGREYELLVTPLDTSRRVESQIEIVTDTPRDHPRTFQLFASVA